MKTPKLINTLKEFMDAGKQKQREQIASIRIVLKKLKKKKQALKQKLRNENDEKIRRQLRKELKIITAQRKKGLCLVKKVNNLN